MIKHTKPDTDYKNAIKIENCFNRYNEVCSCVDMLTEKLHNATLSLDEINEINGELDENIQELEILTSILEQHGYMPL